jgi:hypothetical protein
MKINKVTIAALVGCYWLWKRSGIGNALHSKIIRARIVSFWDNLRRGVFDLELTFLLENRSVLSITVNQFVGNLLFRNSRMATIDLPWDVTPILPGQSQEVTFVVRGKFLAGIAAVILAVLSPGSRLLDGVVVNGKITTTINGKMLTFPYHQEISITL